MQSLLYDKWLPVRCRDGAKGWMAPVELADDNIEDLAAVRADFQGAAWQFLIGLLQTTLAPQNSDKWEDTLEEGLTEAQLLAAFKPVESAFLFGPQTPSFMQDYQSLDGEDTPLAALLPEIPGGNTLKRNTDHFIKRGVVEKLCPRCAAQALFSLQLNAPAGGKGYRTSLRGGGPLTTLLEYKQTPPGTPLWKKLWLNVMPQTEGRIPLPQQYDEAVFPWLAPTRTSEKTITTPEQVHPLQAYWGMPRRIRINFDKTDQGHCDLCGETSAQLLSQMTVKNYGVQYVGWVHPLTPYRRQLKGEGELLSVKGQPGGLCWRDWLGLNWKTNSEHNQEIPARVIRQFLENASDKALRDNIRFWCFGYDFDNMKARCWYEHHIPVLITGNDQELEPLFAQVIVSAGRVLGLLRGALKEAWFGELKNARGDFSFIDIDFWQQTRPLFEQFVEEVKDSDRVMQETYEKRLKGKIWQFAKRYFDERVFTSPDAPIDYGQIMQARRKYFKTSEEKLARRKEKQQEGTK
jgi:CRISPR system Cascade subunit CasA